ncbi:unnamed protein product [Blepharisma stoltei]|uniref:Eukaryotic translation initiation factor 5B n=1 Tax=Blepharisma stoltei TaxID=1481888 RepID=A0AAU9J7C5_9CILI|nr:unnamed protein product [Blepharisma stoltei]
MENSKSANKNKPQAKKQGKQPAAKGKKMSAIAKMALQARMDAEEEEALRLKEEEELKQKEIEEEKKRQEEEKKKKEEAERIKKERLEWKKEQKRLGLWKTPQQLEKERRDREASKAFIEQGLVKPTDESQPRGLPSGKRAKKESVEEKKEIEEAPVEEQKEVEEEKEDDIMDDWENMLEENDINLKQDTTKLKPNQLLHEDELEKVEEKAKPPPPPPKVKKEKKPAADEPAQEFKAPVLCILGHVDTGKTKLLDKIRHTNVQTGEAGGITQQIGATNFPDYALRELIAKLPNMKIDIQIPGLLIIDTPGHESFSNLRSRGSSLCNIGILVVDIMHGLEPQTLESLEMLRKRNIPFIVALNKIDRMYGWKPMQDEAFFTTFNQQDENARDEFMRRARETVIAFAEKGLNAALYYENPDPEEYISLVPTSAITGEGIPDLLGLIVDITQTRLNKFIKYSPQLRATVLEVKVIEGLGTTIDVILANGEINEDDTIVVAGFEGPICTNIRALLTPQPLREMRVKGEYQHHKSIRATAGVKISAQGLDHAMSGSQLLVAESEDVIPYLMEEVQKDVAQIFSSINQKGKGVHVQASTVGSLEALLEFLKESKIPVSSINIGPVFKKDVMKAQSQIEKGNKKQYATVLAFDVKVHQEAVEYAETNGVKIFTADIIYHLFDQFTKYVEDVKREEKLASGKGQDAVFPCVLKIVEVFRTSSPIVLGVDVLGGVLKKGTPLCVPDKNNLIIGKVDSIEFDHKPVESRRQGQGSVAIKLKGMTSDQDSLMVGRHFEETNQLASWITRNSIDSLKEYFMDEMTMEDWKLVKVLKETFGVL